MFARITLRQAPCVSYDTLYPGADGFGAETEPFLYPSEDEKAENLAKVRSQGGPITLADGSGPKSMRTERPKKREFGYNLLQHTQGAFCAVHTNLFQFLCHFPKRETSPTLRGVCRLSQRNNHPCLVADSSTSRLGVPLSFHNTALVSLEPIFCVEAFTPTRNDADYNVTAHLPAACGSPRHRRVQRTIQSFDPGHLLPEDFHDMSYRESVTFTVILDGQKLRPSLVIRYMGKTVFPEGTQGYLYYSPSTTPDLSDGEIRFRVAKPGDPAVTFNEGHDLLSPTAFDGGSLLLIKENPPLQGHQIKPLPHKTIPTNRYIGTLDPQHITSSDFHDISGLLRSKFYVKNFEETSESIYYEGNRKIPGRTIPFPPGTHGFLYYHSQTGDMKEGQLRFRITKDANPTSFVEGEDLLLRKGFPWYMSDSLLRPGGFRSLIPKDDGATKPEMIPAEQQDVTRYDRLPLVIRTQNRPVFAFGQLFSVSFSSLYNLIWIGYGERRRWFMLRYPLFVLNEGRPRAVYDGIALCCFEPSLLPRDRGSTAVVLRLCKIVSPITIKKRDQLPKNLDLRHIPKPPKEGELFERRTSGVRVYRPKPDTHNSRALEFLFRAQVDNSEDGGTLKSAGSKRLPEKQEAKEMA
ncbi:hypothetical protein EW146_g4554 [Bondarzewia mesenterica]|uniref:Uncharacterized protein n=1 Tax=Bondarzewia mesenterica TaxID=1095465 RepID=A0A4S4LWC0_9AGAM|nr:hypothetical protein EW146_g4554 [Bondarzewia mesenterica]